jgi:methylmalonyl-CoA/ethylmalonyl-CoA epimerase
MEFDHAGVATRDGAALAEQYARLLDAGVAHEETFDGMQVVFLDLGNGFFELLEPLEDGPIARYLDEHGPDIHHIALETEDIPAALNVAREHDIELIDEEPRPGAWGHDVAFLDPGSTGGIMIEFVEH